MSDAVVIVAAAGAAALLPELVNRVADTALPIPPLPNPDEHNAAWNAAWQSLYSAKPLGIARKRAVTLFELAQEQIAKAGTPSHLEEAEWLRAWLDAYRAGFAADHTTFGPLSFNGKQYGGGGDLSEKLEEAAVDKILDGEDVDVELGRVGLALRALANHHRRVLADSGSVPWVTGGDPNEVTINTTRELLRVFAAALDEAESRDGFFGQVGHALGDAASGVGDLLGRAASSAGDALGSLLGGALSGVGQGLIPLALVGGGLFLIWKASR